MTKIKDLKILLWLLKRMKRTFLNSESISEDTFEKEEQIEYDLLNQISELFTAKVQWLPIKDR